MEVVFTRTCPCTCPAGTSRTSTPCHDEALMWELHNMTKVAALQAYMCMSCSRCMNYAMAHKHKGLSHILQVLTTDMPT